ncbi:MAG: hypothetical protein AAF821_02530 [Cyanobacteria bacterium P01_D01_bin.156]
MPATAIAAEISTSLQIGGLQVQAALDNSTLLVKLKAPDDLEQSSICNQLRNLLLQTNFSEINSCKVACFVPHNSQALWIEEFELYTSAEQLADFEPLEAPPITSSDSSQPMHPIPKHIAEEGKKQSAVKPNRWKLPGVNFSELHKVGSQVTGQAVKAAQETASTATEQALRSSIDQTMNAFQIAVEQIYARKIPAKMTALTGTINVGVIQLSIRVDIPMDEETGEITFEVNDKDTSN